MTYYQLLKQRRLALRLSIQDVSSQTRLAPQYIKAIEENNLAIFGNDYSFIRYFTQAYCEAIGVNWQAVQPQVEANVAAYMDRTGDIQMEPQTQSAPVKRSRSAKSQGKTKKSATGGRKKQKKKKTKKNSLFARIRKMNRSKNAFIYRLAAIGIVMILGLSIINIGISHNSKRQAALEEEQRQAELKEKENETERLAKQKEEEDKANEIEIRTTDKENNVFELTNVIEGAKELNFVIKLPRDTTVAIYQDEQLVTDDAEQIYSGTFERTIKVEDESVIQVEIGDYDGNEITLNGKTIKFDETNWVEETPAILYFEVKAKNSKEDEDEDEENTEEAADDVYYSEEPVYTEETY